MKAVGYLRVSTDHQRPTVSTSRPTSTRWRVKDIAAVLTVAFVEIDDQALQRYDTCGFEVIDRLSANQHRLFRLSRSGREIAITPQEVSDLLDL